MVVYNNANAVFWPDKFGIPIWPYPIMMALVAGAQCGFPGHPHARHESVVLRLGGNPLPLLDPGDPLPRLRPCVAERRGERLGEAQGANGVTRAHACCPRYALSAVVFLLTKVPDLHA